MKLTRRNFLKGLATIGAISPFLDIEKIKSELDSLTDDHLEELQKVEKIKEHPQSPYVLDTSIRAKWYTIELKDGNTLYMQGGEILKRYGGIFYLSQEDNVKSIHPVDYPANIND